MLLRDLHQLDQSMCLEHQSVEVTFRKASYVLQRFHRYGWVLRNRPQSRAEPIILSSRADSFICPGYYFVARGLSVLRLAGSRVSFLRLTSLLCKCMDCIRVAIGAEIFLLNAFAARVVNTGTIIGGPTAVQFASTQSGFDVSVSLPDSKLKHECTLWPKFDNSFVFERAKRLGALLRLLSFQERALVQFTKRLL
jgi:hypothetical protein